LDHKGIEKIPKEIKDAKDTLKKLNDTQLKLLSEKDIEEQIKKINKKKHKQEKPYLQVQALIRE
jgi:hypothetical protein